ncbi:hypothetical protein KUCAC02_002013, partial [Chaenocephalus aceratus]
RMCGIDRELVKGRAGGRAPAGTAALSGEAEDEHRSLLVTLPLGSSWGSVTWI